MNLYAAYNGYVGESVVMALVIAKDETQALDLAIASFRRDESERPVPRPDYWENVQVELIAPCNKPFATRPTDGGIDLLEIGDPKPVTRQGMAATPILKGGLVHLDLDGHVCIFTGHILQDVVGVALHDATPGQTIEYLVSGMLS